MELIELTNVLKQYDDGKVTALNNLNLSIQNALLHEAKNTDAYSLFLPHIGKSGTEYTSKFINV